jgi:hypothetical protein
VQIVTKTVRFDPGQGGPMVQSIPHTFPRRILQASAALQSFYADFTDGDHEFGELTVTVDVARDTSTPNDLQVQLVFGLRDWSGNWDDTYRGEIGYCLFVETEALLQEPVIGSEPDAVQLLEGTMGDAVDLAYPRNVVFRQTVALSTPPKRYNAVLRGFTVKFQGDDHDLHRIRVMVEAVPGEDASHVEVVGRVTLQDTSEIGSPIQAEVHYTLVVE